MIETIIIALLAATLIELAVRILIILKFGTLKEKSFMEAIQSPLIYDFRAFNKFGKKDPSHVKHLFRFFPLSAELRDCGMDISMKKIQDILAQANNVDREAVIKAYTGKVGFEESRYRPFVGFSTIPNEDISYCKTDQCGFQGEHRTIMKPPNVKRVIILGGSVAFGQGATDQKKTLTARLKYYLDQKEEEIGSNIKWEVINQAFVASQSISELNQFIIYSSLYSPDIVVQLSGHNDLLLYTYREEDPKLYTYHFQEMVLGFLYSSIWMKIFEELASHSFAIRVVFKLAFSRKPTKENQLYTVW